MTIRTLITLNLLILSLSSLAQFEPPAGVGGSSAVHADSTFIIGWGEVVEITRGPMSVANLSLGEADYGLADDALGMADNMVVSLGDGGSANFSFSTPIANNEGPDFAVFENSFTDDFLELCLVEVSSDGINYFRFDAISLTQTIDQISSFGVIDATKVYNLGGKYRGMYGTPFDLQELEGIAGLNINSITNIKVIDVVGSINPEYASFDSQGNIVNDPWPTEFGSSGFDLDAIGIINLEAVGISKPKISNGLKVFPNPANDILNIDFENNFPGDITIEIFNIYGSRVFSEHYNNCSPNSSRTLNINKLNSGVYNVILSGVIENNLKLVITK